MDQTHQSALLGNEKIVIGLLGGTMGKDMEKGDAKDLAISILVGTKEIEEVPLSEQGKVLLELERYKKLAGWED